MTKEIQREAGESGAGTGGCGRVREERGGRKEHTCLVSRTKRTGYAQNAFCPSSCLPTTHGCSGRHGRCFGWDVGFVELVGTGRGENAAPLLAMIALKAHHVALVPDKFAQARRNLAKTERIFTFALQNTIEIVRNLVPEVANFRIKLSEKEEIGAS